MTAEVVTTTERRGRERLNRVLARPSLASRLDERVMLAVGSALVAGGLAAVVVGYLGASHTILVAGQVPYLISGGLLGVALVFLGGLVYFAYWLALLVREARAERAAAQAEREQLRLVLAELARSVEELGRAPRRPARTGQDS